MRKLTLAVLAAGGLLIAAASQAVVNDITDQYKAGDHNGEVKQLSADIEFSGYFGETVTNAGGINYNFWGMTFHEDKVYPSKYWGTVPLYFFGQPVIATVTMTNHGPRERIKLRVTTQAYGMNVDGTNGVRLAEDRVSEFWVGKGETQRVDATFTPQYVAGADSGLDRVVILVQHVNEGGEGKGNPYPALIMVKEAILCPPSIEDTAKAAKK